uniref:Uncharacterized protein n=1 Tax=Arion vulgaris TaxID=1028688 RepID=A0A0B7BPQ9_9EUPU
MHDEITCAGQKVIAFVVNIAQHTYSYIMRDKNCGDTRGFIKSISDVGNYYNSLSKVE